VAEYGKGRYVGGVERAHFAFYKVHPKGSLQGAQVEENRPRLGSTGGGGVKVVERSPASFK